jgi:hypothetical protein
MNEASNLENALQFVTRRIEEEAMRSGKPLTEEEHLLLLHLPTQSTLPDPYSLDPESPPLILPRDLVFERLCTLAKAAHRQDLQLNPNDCNWQFAKAVAELNRHPISWLLGWAGVKIPRPKWDGCLLIVAALVSISVWMVLMFVGTETRIRFRWVIAAIGCAVVLATMLFGTRWLEKSQLQRTIQRCRRG